MSTSAPTELEGQTRITIKGRELPWSTLAELIPALAAQHGDRPVLEIDGRCIA